jgi:hypothetical protein
MNENPNNPFGNMEMATTAPKSESVMASTAIEREVSEVKAAVILARQFPRDQIKAMDRILVACQRPTLAVAAIYEYQRGGTDISGPSIRLAEAIAQAWGNIQFGIRELEQKNGESTIESYAWDLETNVRQSKVFQVPHKRFTKKGSYALSDPRDIYELTANQGARRLRACILGIIPSDVIEAATSECEKTMRTSIEITPESIKAMLGKFTEYKVTQEQIEKRIQRRIDAIQPAQFVGLRKIYNSLKDGMSASQDWFDMTPETVEELPKSGTQAAKDAIKKKRADSAEPAPSPDPSAVDPPESVICEKNGERVFTEFCDGTCADRANCPARE